MPRVTAAQTNLTPKPPRVSRRAQNNPVLSTGIVSSSDAEIGQLKPRRMRSDGPAISALETPNVEPRTDPVLDTEKLDNMRFMNEVIEVHIQKTHDKQAEQVFEVGVNGKRVLFRRGETKRVKRMFVNVLAQQKITSYTQERKRDENGVMIDVQVPESTLRYPFNVTDDPSPMGKAWLQSVLAQA